MAVPKLRRWLISPWPYLGGLVALAVFAPVILWNADHHWVSFLKQFGRARIENFRPAFLAELIPTQVAFATPLVFILGAMGLHALIWRNAGAFAARMLINTMFWTIVLYFIWHSLHARVEANWFAPVYPALAISAAVAAHLTRWDKHRRRLADFCLRWASPVGVVLFAFLIVQANTGVFTGYRRDATVRSVGVGWRELAGEIEAVRLRTGATCVLAPDYGTTGWLAFYLPKGTCVVQPTQRIRWVNMPEPDPALLSGKLLFVDEARRGARSYQTENFAGVERVAELKRMRGPLVIETYGLDLLEGAEGQRARPLPAAGTGVGGGARATVIAGLTGIHRSAIRVEDRVKPRMTRKIVRHPVGSPHAPNVLCSCPPIARSCHEQFQPEGRNQFHPETRR